MKLILVTMNWYTREGISYQTLVLTSITFKSLGTPLELARG